MQLSHLNIDINNPIVIPTLHTDSALINYVLMLADSTLVLTQRNAAWCGHGPILEQDIAITNITLDLIGQARNFYQYAALLINEQSTRLQIPKEETEDSLAYLREERAFKNLLLTEQENGDWAQTIVRQFFFSVYQYLLFEQLQHREDKQLAAIAAKSLKEVTYHVKWSTEWVIRLGDGTKESTTRMQNAVAELWQYTGELFIPSAYETELAAQYYIPALSSLKDAWLTKIEEVFTEATLANTIQYTEGKEVYMQRGGKEGIHTEKLGYLLAEMQYLQRVHPGAAW